MNDFRERARIFEFFARWIVEHVRYISWYTSIRIVSNNVVETTSFVLAALSRKIRFVPLGTKRTITFFLFFVKSVLGLDRLSSARTIVSFLV